MNDPYRVLGVSPTASDDEIKAAYRELAQKYHPDHYENSPLSDLASEKMAEINDAYDEIIKQRRNGHRSGSANRHRTPGWSAGYRSNGGHSQFADIRRMIAMNRFDDADQLLAGVLEKDRDAEWHFLKGSVLYRRGWFEDAANHFNMAHAMEPGNAEYASAAQQIRWRRAGGSRGYNPSAGSSLCGSSGCDICTGLLCTDCCCECMGGDLIPCC